MTLHGRHDGPPAVPASEFTDQEDGGEGKADQTVSDTDQTLSDSDQSASDSDQTRADRDQAAADSDQAAADSDQAASDHDLAAGVNSEAHAFSRGIRQRSSRERDSNAQGRLEIAMQRDAIAHLRDLSAKARDEAAEARDRAMALLDDAYSERDGARALTGVELVARAADQRRRAAEQRARAAGHRMLAAEDRRAAAQDREFAAAERREALHDREALAADLSRAAIDGLTRARTRAAGLRELDSEVDRAARNNSPLVVAYLDVVGLKAVNDTGGHASGDALLRRVVDSVQVHLRPYDLVIRIGGDEFLSVMSNLTVEAAQERFRAIARTIEDAPERGAIRVGFAELHAGETADELIARADDDLIRRPRNGGVIGVELDRERSRRDPMSWPALSRPQRGA